MAEGNFLLNGGGLYAYSSKGKKCVVMGCVMAFFFLLGSLSAAVCVEAIPTEGWNMRIAQGVSAFFAFVMGPLVAIWLVSARGVRSALGLERENRVAFSLKWGLMAALGLLMLLPAVNYLASVNEGMELPECMGGIEKWMRDSEKETADLTDEIIATGSWLALGVNILVIALIPAVGEELMFRVIFQGGMQKMGLNAVVSVVITSVVFSAVHLQFFGFLPRLLLSLYLGFLYVCGRGMWMNSFAHFANNGMAVVAYFIMYRLYGTVSQGAMEDTGSGMPVMCMLSLCAVSLFCVWMYRRLKV